MALMVGGGQAALGCELEEGAGGQRGGLVGKVRDGVLIDAIVVDLRGKERGLLLGERDRRGY